MGIFKVQIGQSDNGLPEIEANACQYTMNDLQQLIVIAADFEKTPIKYEQVPGIKCVNMGKLTEQSAIFEAQVINSLERDGWDFEADPNPEIVLISRVPEIMHYKGGK